MQAPVRWNAVSRCPRPAGGRGILGQGLHVRAGGRWEGNLVRARIVARFVVAHGRAAHGNRCERGLGPTGYVDVAGVVHCGAIAEVAGLVVQCCTGVVVQAPAQVRDEDGSAGGRELRHECVHVGFVGRVRLSNRRCRGQVAGEGLVGGRCNDRLGVIAAVAAQAGLLRVCCAREVGRLALAGYHRFAGDAIDRDPVGAVVGSAANQGGPYDRLAVEAQAHGKGVAPARPVNRGRCSVA